MTRTKTKSRVMMFGIEISDIHHIQKIEYGVEYIQNHEYNRNPPRRKT